jgi:predicted transcriptional regulator
MQMQRKEPVMKTASMPSLRVDPDLRRDAESVLRDGETLSSFMEQALRSSIQSRRAQKEFIARGLSSREEAQRTGEYFSSEDVLIEMEDMLTQAESKTRK